MKNKDINLLLIKQILPNRVIYFDLSRVSFWLSLNMQNKEYCGKITVNYIEKKYWENNYRRKNPLHILFKNCKQ